MDKIIADITKKEIALDDLVKIDIEKAFEQLNLDDIMISPSLQLQDFGHQLAEVIFKKYANQYILNGVNLAERIVKKKTDVIISNV